MWKDYIKRQQGAAEFLRDISGFIGIPQDIVYRQGKEIELTGSRLNYIIRLNGEESKNPERVKAMIKFTEDVCNGKL